MRLHSATEIDYHLMIARDLGAISKADYAVLITDVVEVRMLLQGLIRRLDSAQASTRELQRAVPE